MMNKIISFGYIFCVLVASVHCSSYGDGYGSYADVQSYSLGSADYGAPAYQSHYKLYSSKPKYSVQPLSSYDLYPGRNSYKSYHYAPSYSQVALPVINSAPLAKLYNVGQHYYDGPAGRYGGAY